ncbi:MAG: flagellar hook-associated protein FlgK [Rhodobacteraceae bacterium]|nr:flagellar hook-associated protein FlgK [Paracoccaceae bacterium]
MSISSAFNSAMSGLNAASRASAIVSENIANAMTHGYSRRSLSLTSNSLTGPGVRVIGIVRHSDPVIVANRRVGDASFASANTLAGFHTGFESLVGTVTDPSSISSRLATFESSLISSASMPNSTQRLDIVASAARDLAQSISQAAQGVQDLRTHADKTINLQVDTLNSALESVQELNVRITAANSRGSDIASLQDQRQLLIDEINQLVPVREIERQNGQIALYTEGGAILLDGPAATVEFTPVNLTTPDMSIENGTLFGLEINGSPVSTKAFSGGELAAQFHIRDDLAVTANADLDGVARDLIERFETLGLDPSQPAGAPGLFTDNGSALNPADETGLALRLSLNNVVDPAQGGESWRLRDGLGAAGPGSVGDATLLQAFESALTENRVSGSPIFGSAQYSAADVAAELMSKAGLRQDQADQTLSFAATNKTELTRIELAMGVDTDAELQTLMVVEQAYAANARVIEAVDQMMDELMRLGQ